MSLLGPRSSLQRPRVVLLINIVEVSLVLLIVASVWVARSSDPRQVVEATRHNNGLSCVHTPTGQLRPQEHSSLDEARCLQGTNLDAQEKDLCVYLAWARTKVNRSCQFFHPSLLDVMPTWDGAPRRLWLTLGGMAGIIAAGLVLSLLMGWLRLRGELFTPRVRGLMACAVLGGFLAIGAQMARARTTLADQKRLVDEWWRQCKDTLAVTEQKREELEHVLKGASAAGKDAKNARAATRAFQFDDLKKMLTDLHTDWTCPADNGPSQSPSPHLVTTRPVIVSDDEEATTTSGIPAQPPPSTTPEAPPSPSQPPGGTTGKGGQPPPDGKDVPPPATAANPFDLCKISPVILLISGEVGIVAEVLCQLPGILKLFSGGERNGASATIDTHLVGVLKRVHENRATEDDLRELIGSLGDARQSGAADPLLRELTGRYGSSSAVGDWFARRCGNGLDCKHRDQAFKALTQSGSVCSPGGNPDQLLEYMWQTKCGRK